MNSKPNIFLSSLPPQGQGLPRQQGPPRDRPRQQGQDRPRQQGQGLPQALPQGLSQGGQGLSQQPKSEEFLNTLNDLTRDMYHQNKDPIPVADHRFEGDMLLHQSDRLKNKESLPVTGHRLEGDMLLNRTDRLQNKDKDKDRLVKDLRDEIKSLKQKMNFVIEKDEEIYKLKCENELMRKDVAEYQSVVTDESLRASNDELTLEANDLHIQLETLKEENVTLKQKLVHFYRENERLQKTANPGGVNRELREKLIQVLLR
jgi:hypothetical protein